MIKNLSFITKFAIVNLQISSSEKRKKSKKKGQKRIHAFLAFS
jgi:hypothetical protein